MGDIISILVACGQEKDLQFLLNSLSEQEDFCIVDVEKNELDAILKSMLLKPDVLIMDIHSSSIDEPTLAPVVRRRSPSTAIAVIRDKFEDNYAARALKAGIAGILLKEADMDKLAPIVRIICSGGYFISASITNRIFGAISFLNQFPGQVSEVSKYWFEYKTNNPLFSPAERGIITHIALGLSDREIADYLHFSPGTIRNYLTGIRRRTKLKSRTQIVIYSLINGIISFDQISEHMRRLE